jgi:hypothetical protein
MLRKIVRNKLLILALFVVSNAYSQDNQLSGKEKKEGWQLLFDGKSMSQWKSASSDSFPSKGWAIANGVLFVDNESGSALGGDIITRKQFEDFEFAFDFKLTEGANSGVKYSVQKFTPAVPGLGSVLGPEYQLLDNDKHPDAKAGRNGNRKLASLYDILPSSTEKAIRPIGEWNSARIVSKGNHVEHWLNGIRVLEYDTTSDLFTSSLAQSKFKPVKDFGKKSSGYLLLQDHGNKVFFKNIKVREI